jgi:hypothetical protein
MPCGNESHLHQELRKEWNRAICIVF